MLPRKIILNNKYLIEVLRGELSVMQKLKGNNDVRLLDLWNHKILIIQFKNIVKMEIQDLISKIVIFNRGWSNKNLTDILKDLIELLQQGIIHHNLKPANILVHQNTFKIGDFGFAKCISNFQRVIMESIVGTQLYMAPQILMLENTSKYDILPIGYIFRKIHGLQTLHKD